MQSKNRRNIYIVQQLWVCIIIIKVFGVMGWLV